MGTTHNIWHNFIINQLNGTSTDNNLLYIFWTREIMFTFYNSAVQPIHGIVTTDSASPQICFARKKIILQQPPRWILKLSFIIKTKNKYFELPKFCSLNSIMYMTWDYIYQRQKLESFTFHSEFSSSESRRTFIYESSKN